MVTGKPGQPDKYIPIWNFQQGERQRIVISRMVFYKDEEEFVDQKKLRQKTGSGKEIMARELENKKKKEKFYLNPYFPDYYTKEWMRSKGFSIFRFQLPELISALQSICDGERDDEMSSQISELINPEENTEAIAEARRLADEKRKETEESDDNADDLVYHADHEVTKEIYDKWVNEQPERIKKEILKLQGDGWTKERIYNIINSKDYRDVYDE